MSIVVFETLSFYLLMNDVIRVLFRSFHFIRLRTIANREDRKIHECTCFTVSMHSKNNEVASETKALVDMCA